MKILVADPIAEQGIARLREEANVDVQTGLSPSELLAIIGDYEALVVRSETKVTDEVISAGERLQVIARAGVGVDNIDIKTATQKGIMVVNAPAGNTISAAEHTIAMMLALSRYIPQANSQLKSGLWQRQKFVGAELRNKVLGLAGLGNVGSEVARRAQCFQMRVIAYDPFISPEYAAKLRVELVSFEELLSQADFISLHLPLTAETRGIIGAKELAKVKPNVRLINCARGGLVDEDALLEAIESGRVAGAALDVFSEEPPLNSPLLKNEKVIATPHLGASTSEAQTTVALDVANQVIAVLHGQPVRYAVNAPLIPPEILPVLGPFLEVASLLGKMVAQLTEGQLSKIDIEYDGEVANYDASALKATLLGGLLEKTCEEKVNLINANIIAQNRGLKITERRNPVCENYANLLTVAVATSIGTTTVAATLMREEIHIVRVNDYWMDLVPREGYFLFADHRDRPGLVASVGMVTGNADINISFMLLSRLKPRGQALMVLALDEPLDESHLQQILSIPDVYSAKVVKL
jgi:D-3-phosphoglycerate dehydrogenase